MVLVAVTQMTSSGVLRENLGVAVQLIAKAAAAGAKAVFLPEATDFIAPAQAVPALTRSDEHAEFVREICAAAKQHLVWVSVGIHEAPRHTEDSARCFNSQLLVDPCGVLRACYRKLHLYDVDIQHGPSILESNTTVGGAELVPPVATTVGAIGQLLTCYDMRFPEAALSLRRQGAHVLTFPSAFAMRTGAAHWSLLLRARAVDTQCFVLAAAQVGPHPGTLRTSWGHAMIVDPWGSIIAQCSDMTPYTPTFCVADVDLQMLETVRAEMPLWDQRRGDIYATL
ncbi:beta-ureidopropionase [Malassezia vespertilionis]|uniref:beta-ureidopropionase n=1 Tax=Malassezia vespertilionis TaxID=2020962 RepID=UPI0024B0A8B5|nr:beta-ureidopropionase [Malassezia vespertilionis]WFD06352.1 beta-ureidopropionase [Malassezia vespertilionis]